MSNGLIRFGSSISWFVAPTRKGSFGQVPPFPDFADFMSTVDAAIAAGFADSHNLFVTGGSHGCYASAGILGKTDRFCPGALKRPVINWVSKVLNADISAVQYEYTYASQP